ncbi:MAG: CHC2 zinc finger domain-containing protein, partial [Pirellulaceae bacterium]|nr:CHC2 zinc finger domain-containing protein [Pirellulaceae bacterium]
MPFGSDNDAKDRIRQSVDIVELVGGYLELRRQGRLFMALCPWHEDSRPSLQVNPDRQTWRCWVCNDGGDIFSFVQKREGVGFREALEMLAERAGVELDTRRPAAKPGSPEDKKTLYEAASWAAEQFHQFLLTDDGAASARAYAERRGITAESIRHFRIGFS